jgi:hypothetical protein
LGVRHWSFFYAVGLAVPYQNSAFSRSATFPQNHRVFARYNAAAKSNHIPPTLCRPADLCRSAYVIAISKPRWRWETVISSSTMAKALPSLRNHGGIAPDFIDLIRHASAVAMISSPPDSSSGLGIGDEIEQSLNAKAKDAIQRYGAKLPADTAFDALTPAELGRMARMIRDWYRLVSRIAGAGAIPIVWHKN